MLFELRQNGISLAPEEPMVEDQWQKSYKLRKSIERGEMPLSRAAVDASRWHRLELACAKAKHLAKYMSGAPHVDMKLTQFALNERKVLRFKAYWDDHTPQPDRSHVMSLNNGSFLEEHHLPSTDFMLFQWFSDVFSFVRGCIFELLPESKWMHSRYGSRVYFIVHYFLADNSVEINEAQCRNSGRDAYPMFMKRGQLSKTNQVLAVPGLLAAEGQIYYPADFRVGGSINVWGRKLVIYDCRPAGRGGAGSAEVTMPRRGSTRPTWASTSGRAASTSRRSP